MKRLVVLVSLFALLVLGSMPPALAVKPDREVLPPNDDLLIDGVCGFPVLLHDVRSKIHVTTFFDQERNVTKQIGAGPLVVELSRTSIRGKRSLSTSPGRGCSPSKATF